MKKQQTMKKLAVAVVAANVMASTVITAMPANIMAAEETPATPQLKSSMLTAKSSVRLVDVGVMSGTATVSGNTFTFNNGNASGGLAGSIMTKEKVNLRNSFTLTTTLGFGGGAADGVSFVMQNNAGPSVFGGPGDGMCLTGLTKAIGIAMRAQTWYSPARQNVSFYKYNQFFDTKNTVGSLTGTNQNLTIKWNGQTRTLSYAIAGITSSYQVPSLTDTFGGESAYIGLVGVIGQGTNTHMAYGPLLDVDTGDSPVIQASDKTLNIGETFSPLAGVTATDTEDGNITSSIKVTANDVDTSKAGTYHVTYSVTDANLNVTTKTITVNVAIPAPTVGKVTTQDQKVTVTGLPNMETTISLKNGESITKTSDADGKATFTIEKQEAGNTIQATQKSNGITSSAGSTVVALNAPVVSPFTTADTNLIVTGDPNAKITIMLPDGSEIIKTAGADGKVTFAIGTQKLGDTIEAIQSLNSVTSDKGSVKVTQGTVATPTIGGVTTDDTTVTGTGIAGATMTITIKDKDYTGTVGADGKYSIAIPKQTVGTEIAAKQTSNSITSTSVTTKVTQGKVDAPTMDAVTTDDTAVTGTGTAGATVTLTIKGTDYTGTVGADGKYSVTIPKQAEGTTITEKQTLNGVTSSEVSKKVTQGKVAAPTVNAVTSDDTTVTGTGVAGATVTLTIGGTNYTGTVGSDGKYSITIPKQTSGTTISGKQTLNGVSSSDVSTKVTQGTVATPTINGVTTDSTAVTGTGVAGATVTLTIKGVPYTGTVGTDGKYSITIPKQVVGTSVVAKQTLNGVTSANVSKPVTQGTVAAPTISAVTSNDTAVTGTGLVGATVTITIGSTNYTGTVAADGKYSITIPKQAEGTNITAKQAISNVSSTSVSTKVTQGTVAVPTINAVTTDDTDVTGTGIVGAAVTVTIGGTNYTGTVGADGKYSITIPKQASGTAITAKQTVNSITSAAASTTVKQGVVSVPTIDGVTTDSTAVTGTGIAGATVTLTISGGTYTGTVAANGKYSITIPKQAAGTSIVAKQTIGGVSSANVSKTVTQGVLAAPTIDTYNLKDNYVTGKAPTGTSKIALYTNGTFVRYGAVAADGTYSVWGKDVLLTSGQAFDVYAVNAAGQLSPKASSTVKSGKSLVTTAPTIDSYTIGSSYATGKVGDNTKKIALYTNGVFVRNGAVAADGTYKVWASDVLTTAGQTFEVRPIDAEGIEGPKATSTVIGKSGTKVGAPTIDDYILKTTYLTGEVSEGTARIALYVDDKLVKYGVVADDGTYKIYASDSLTTAGQTFKVVPFDANGTAGNSTTGTVKTKDVAPKLGAPTITDYKLGTSYVTGTTVAGTTRVGLYTNGALVRNATVAADGTFKVWGSDALTAVGQAFEVRPYDAAGVVGNVATSTVK
ncbi:beta strand repeat-containing protein [Listeria booriae]|uniref:DUF5011 domain-containing protein n=1 Tax=Listeria booriae TaxID=1552123 RepID=A0A7X0YM08_9LIST|nr:Ig-like domain-containing protein [Listeria booriae]MBC2116925.1 DUF5011 domain-containing protein [Listeria booriae]